MWGIGAALAAPGEQDDGGLVWAVPRIEVSLRQSDQPAGSAQAPTAGLPVLPAAPATALPLGGVSEHDDSTLLLDLFPPLPMVPTSNSGDATSTLLATSYQRAAEAAEDRKAIVREKNRLAQQRFRQKERAKLAAVEGEAEVLRSQLSQLRLENERLQLEQALLEKLLAVRNAILSVVAQLDTLPAQQPQQPQQPQQLQAINGGSTPAALAVGLSASALLQDPAALQAATQQLAAALGELPSLDLVEQLVGQLSEGSGPGTAGRGASHGSTGPNTISSGCGGSNGGSLPTTSGPAAALAAGGGAASPVGLPAISATAEAAAASGLQIEKSRLKEVAPPPTATAQLVIENIEHVESLLEEWQQWRLGLRQRFKEAQANQFADQKQVDALAAHMQSFIEVFWAACHVRPQLFNLFLMRSLPPAGMDWSGEWARIAEESLPLLSSNDVAVFRQAMQQYTKRVAIAAVGVRPWVRRLQDLMAVQRSSLSSMHQAAAQFAQICEVTARLQHACTEHYLAYMGLLSQVSAQSSVVLRSLWHSSSDPFAPDHPAIVSHILRLHQQRQRQQQLTAAEPAPSAADAQQATALAGSEAGPGV